MPVHLIEESVSMTSLFDCSITVISEIYLFLSFQCVGVHEHSFTGINIDNVFRGEIDIQIMDYTCQLVRVRYQCQYGMLPPSYLQALLLNGKELPRKIPKNVRAVKMHYSSAHYVLSARKNENIVVFDSLPSQSHLKDVIPQLTALYENFDINDIQ